MGIKFSVEAKERLKQSKAWETSTVITELDVVNIVPRVREMSLISYAKVHHSLSSF